MLNAKDFGAFSFFFCATVIVVLIALALIFKKIVPFFKIAHEIKEDMQRADSEEYKQLQQELRELYTTHIPLLRLFKKYQIKRRK